MTDQKRVTFADTVGPDVDQLFNGINPDRRKRLADIESNVRRRKDCEERAHHIVLRLVDNPITEEFLIGAAQLLEPSHYADITEERAIEHLCGYPLCLKQLPKQPKQKYHISVSHKKVYDITERKNFCSNQCFKASKHFERQISAIAVWARDKEAPTVFDILPLDSAVNKGKVGQAVLRDPSAHIRLELNALEENDRKNAERKTKMQPPETGTTRPTATDNLDEVTIDQLAEQVSDMLLIGNEEDESKAYGEVDDCGIDSVEKVDVINSRHEYAIDDGGGSAGLASQGSAPVRAVDPRSNDPMVPVQRLDPVCRGEAEARQVEQAINSKAKLITALIDQREALRASTDDNNKKPMQKITDPVSAQCSDKVGKTRRGVSAARVMENISKVKAQRKTMEKALAQRQSQKRPKASPIVCLERCLLEWRTLDTYAYLSGGRIEPDMVEFEKKYGALGARVGDLSGFIDETGMEDEDSPLNPLPDLNQLRADTEQQELKVKEFYKGNMRYPVVDPNGEPDLWPDTKQLDGDDDTKKKEGEEDFDPVLPLVDKHQQATIRRKIVFGQLSRVLPDLLRPLRLRLQDITECMRQLLNTFSFSSTNIVLKPGEWTLIAFFLLRLLALRMSIVKAAFHVPQTEAFFSALMSNVGMTEEKVQALIHDMSSPSNTTPLPSVSQPAT